MLHPSTLLLIYETAFLHGSMHSFGPYQSHCIRSLYGGLRRLECVRRRGWENPSFPTWWYYCFWERVVSLCGGVQPSCRRSACLCSLPWWMRRQGWFREEISREAFSWNRKGHQEAEEFRVARKAVVLYWRDWEHEVVQLCKDGRWNRSLFAKRV
jgi:hypothetical protein